MLSQWSASFDGFAAPLWIGVGVFAGVGLHGAWRAVSKAVHIGRSASRRRLETALDRLNAAVAVQPFVMLTWTSPSANGDDDGPDVSGGPDALARILALAGVGGGAGASRRLIDGLSGWRAIEDGKSDAQETFADVLHRLKSQGKPFRRLLHGPGDRAIEAHGRTAGPSALLWLKEAATSGAPARGEAAPMAEWLSATGLPTWRRDFDFVVIWTNDAFDKAFATEDNGREGLTPHAFGAQTLSTARAARRQNAAAVERIRLSVHGERRTFDVYETPLGAEGFVGVAVDVTEVDILSRRVDRLIQSRQATFDTLSEGVAVFGADRRMKTANAGFIEMFGGEGGVLRDGIEFGAMLDIFRERRLVPEQTDYRDWKAKELSAFEAPGDERQNTWTLPDGRIFKMSIRVHRDGGLSLIASDITRMTQLEAAYNTAVRVLGATVDNLADGICVFGSDGRLRLHNPTFAKIWALEESFLITNPHIGEVAERTEGAALGSDGWRELHERVTSLEPGLRTPMARRDLHMRDGRIVSVSTTPLPDGATLITFQDVSDTRLREKSLEERNRALETADRMKSQFVSHVSYQLRTPLNAISGFSEILSHEMFGPLNSRQSEYVDGIVEACGQLIKLVDNMIDLALVEAGRLDLSRAPVDLNELVVEAARAFEARSADEDMTISVVRSDDIPMVSLDRARIRQCLDHLTANAIDFGEAGCRITLGASSEDDEVRFWVSDTGRGVPDKDQPLIFDRFEKRGGQGAGLGLSLVRSFIELHGGAVELKSAQGRGTTVVCRLPVDPTKRLGGLAATGSYAPIGPGKGDRPSAEMREDAPTS